MLNLFKENVSKNIQKVHINECFVTFSNPRRQNQNKMKKKLLLNNFFVICRVILSGGGGGGVDLNRIADFFRPYRPALV